MKKLMTIAIPTYNRYIYLEECLKSIFKELEENEVMKKIEIIVSDNASSDSTEKVVNKFYLIMNIKYIKNETNIGPDRNFHQCFTLATGKYILLLSDDDILIKGSLKKIIEILESNERLGIIHLNTCLFNVNAENNYVYDEPRLHIEQNENNIDKIMFLRLINIWITYCSGMIINKDIFMKISNPEQYYDTFFWQSHIFMNIIKNTDKLLIITQPCIGVRAADNTGCYNYYKVWIDSYKELIIKTGSNCGFEIRFLKKIYIDTICKKVSGFILSYRLGNNYKFKISDYVILFKNTIIHPKTWIYLYPNAILPTKFLLLLRKLKHLIKR